MSLIKRGRNSKLLGNSLKKDSLQVRYRSNATECLRALGGKKNRDYVFKMIKYDRAIGIQRA